MKLERCFTVRDGDVEQAERLRRLYREQVEEALDGLDLVLTPTLPIVPPPLGRGAGPGDLDVREALIRFTYPFSSLGWPALALPCGEADGLPGLAPDRGPGRRGRARARCGAPAGADADLKLRGATADEGRVMIAVRRLLLLAVFGVLGLALTGVAEARIDRPAVTPQGLKAFLLRTDEPVKHEFDRTPSFAWVPVRGAHPVRIRAGDQQVVHGELDRLVERERRVRCADDHDDGSRDDAPPRRRRPPSWRSSTRTCARRRSPSISRLPWITGSPYALYAHVRAITSKGPTSWSAPVRLQHPLVEHPEEPQEPASRPRPLVAGRGRDGVPGVALRSQDDIHDDHERRRCARPVHLPPHEPFFTGSIKFRVRAQRALYGEAVSGLPATTWGPWSPVYTDVQPPLSLGDAQRRRHDVRCHSRTRRPALAHALTPGFAFGGDSGGPLDYNGGAPAELFRVYIATDEDCVNIVYRGADRRQPGLCTPHDRAARAARLTQTLLATREATPRAWRPKVRP